MDIFASVTEKVLEQLRVGVLPWRKTWGDKVYLPMNAKNNKHYQGVNIALLWLANRKYPHWATEKTWSDLDAFVEDRSPTEIYFSTYINKRTGGKMPFMKAYNVYNLDQVRGCDHLRFLPPTAEEFHLIDELISATGAIVMESNSPYYDVGNDIINIPPRRCFGSSVGYWTTKLHELVHWTGNSKRLNRVFGARNSREYAEEELVAALGTCFMAAAMNLPSSYEEIPNHASYIRDWLSQLRNDKQAFWRAASAAQKSTNFLLKHLKLGLTSV
jgi:antirestriction protein ArdC